MIKVITPIIISITALMSIAHFYAIKEVDKKWDNIMTSQAELNSRIIHSIEILEKRVEQNTDAIEQLVITVSNIKGE